MAESTPLTAAERDALRIHCERTKEGNPYRAAVPVAQWARALLDERDALAARLDESEHERHQVWDEHLKWRERAETAETQLAKALQDLESRRALGRIDQRRLAEARGIARRLAGAYRARHEHEATPLSGELLAAFDALPWAEPPDRPDLC